MNERIKELARQSTGVSTIYMLEEEWTKFAELIVKECAKNAVLFADSITVQGLPTKYIENYMLKHFGVKE